MKKSLLILFAVLSCALLPRAFAASIIQAPASSFIGFEADTTAKIIAGTPETWVTTNDVTATGGTALYSDGVNTTGTSPHSFAQYSLKFKVPGTYYLYYRWKADPARNGGDVFTANSSQFGSTFGAYSTPGDLTPFYVAASNGSQGPTNSVFYWQRETDSHVYTVTQDDVNAATPLVFTLGTREAGMSFDRFIFSTVADLTQAQLDATANSDTDVVFQGAADSFVGFEADGAAAKIIAGTPETWVTTNDVTATGGTALYSDGVNTTGTSPHSFAQYALKFKVPGTYYLYYRWKADPARNGGDVFTANSSQFGSTFGAYSTPGDLSPFYVAASNGSQGPTNSVFFWQREADAHVYTVTQDDVNAATPLIFTLGTREAGMSLDRFVFSTVPDLSQAQLDATPNSGAQASGLTVKSAVGSASLTKARVIFNRPLDASSIQAGDFKLSGGVAVTAAEVDPTDSRKVNLTTGAQAQGTVYTVTINGISDDTGSAIKADSKVNFTAWKLVSGWVTREIYLGIPGSTVGDLTAAANFPDSPDQISWSKAFAIKNEPLVNQYGVRLSGYFTPASNGTYDFYLNNDDEAELQLSSDKSSANLQSLATFPLNAPPFDSTSVVTSPALVANQSYLLVGLLKQDGGDVYLQVAAQPSSSSADPASLPVLNGNQISTFINPDIGVVTFKQQPTNVTASAGSRARFAVKIESDQSPVYYQWRLNGTPILGAIRAAYITPVLAAADSGQVYDVVVSVAGKDTASGTATLTVGPGSPSNIQPYLGVNFVGGGGGGPGGPLSSADVAGVVQQGNWNSLTGTTFDPSASPLPLVDANGAVSPVTLTLVPAEGQTLETWYSGTMNTGDADGALMQGFVDAQASVDPMTITLNGVPPGEYNLLVYSTGFDFTPNYFQGYAVTGAGAYPAYHGKSETGLGYIAKPAFRRMSSQNAAAPDTGNYVQFDKVSPAADGSLSLTVTWEPADATINNTHQPAINAIQLVKLAAVNPGQPSLKISRAGQNVTIEWTEAANGFVLESSSTVGPAAAWSRVSQTPNPIASSGSVAVAIGSGNQFFRLRK